MKDSKRELVTVRYTERERDKLNNKQSTGEKKMRERDTLRGRQKRMKEEREIQRENESFSERKRVTVREREIE